VANGDPGNDQPAIMLALGATLVARGPKGERSIAANQFYKGLYETALARNEILTEIRIPVSPAKSGGAYSKLKRKTGDFAVAAAAVQLTLNAKGAIERAAPDTNRYQCSIESLQRYTGSPVSYLPRIARRSRAACGLSRQAVESGGLKDITAIAGLNVFASVRFITVCSSFRQFRRQHVLPAETVPPPFLCRVWLPTGSTRLP